MQIKLSKFKPNSFFLKKKKYFAGRNNFGKITVAHRGGGNKKFLRKITWKRTFSEGVVINYAYDPLRSSRLAQISHSAFLKNKQVSSYILLPKGLKIFDKVKTFFSYDKESFFKPGDASPLINYDIGDLVHNVQFFPNSNRLISKSAGTYSQILQYGNEKFRRLRLPSGHQRLFFQESIAVFGVLENQNHFEKKLKKAGQSRWLGKRPHVRGVAMNPVDHPHGGGQGKTKGGRPSVTPYSLPTKGQPTRNKRKKNIYILKK